MVPARLPLPLDLDRELFQGVFEIPSTGARGFDLVLPSGFAYSGTKSHVLLAACQPNEKSREAKVGGMQRGRFTYHLLRYLRGVDATTDRVPVTYAALVEEVSKSLARETDAEPAGRGSYSNASDSITQTPHCEGSHKHRILFSTEEEAPVDTFPLAYMPVQPGHPCDEEALYVMAGSMQGITEDTQFVYRYLIPDSNGFEAFANIALISRTIEADRSRLSPVGTSGDLAPETTRILQKEMLPEHAMVSIYTWGSKPMKIWCALEVPLAVPRERSKFERVEYHDDADVWCSRYQLDGFAIKYLFQKRDPLSLHFNYTIPILQLSAPITQDDAVLDAIAKYNFHLYRYNASPAVRQDLQFDVRLHPLQSRDNGGLHSILDIAGGHDADLLAKGTSHRLRTDRSSTYNLYQGFEVKEAVISYLKPYYGLTVVNRSKLDLFVYVFYFDPADYSITASTLLCRTVIHDI